MKKVLVSQNHDKLGEKSGKNPTVSTVLWKSCIRNTDSPSETMKDFPQESTPGTYSKLFITRTEPEPPPLYFQSGELTFSSTYMLEESQLQHGKRLLQYSSLQEWSFSIAQPWLCQNSLYAMARFIIPGLLLKEEEGGKPTKCPNKTHTANAMKIHVPAEPTSIQRQPFFPIPRSTLHVVFSISNLPAISNSHPPVNCL